MQRTFSTIAGLAAAMLVAAPAWAWPDRDIDYIIPFNPGGESDIAARMQQPIFQEVTGRQVIVKYQPGAGGAQAWSQLNGMPGDGSVIMGINLPHAIMQPLQGNAGYETADLVPVFWFHYTPDALIVRAESEFESIDQVVAFARDNPGMVTLSGSGTNSANHLAQQTFDQLNGVTTTYIPFSGTGPSVTALLGGQVTAAWGYSTVAMNQGEQVRMLAVASEERLPSFPDVPTFQELGIDMVSGAYRGIAVPASTPVETRRAISDVFAEVNATERNVTGMTNGAFVVIDVPYDEVATFMAERQAEYEALARQMGIID